MIAEKNIVIDKDEELSKLLNFSNLNPSKQYLERAKKLLSFAYSVIKNPIFKNDFDYLLQIFNVTESALLKNFLEYNLDIFNDCGNAVYERIENRIVLHIHNLIMGSWHIDRQNSIIKILNSVKPKTIADIGFGTPSAYIKEIILQQRFPVHLTLGDLYQSAFQFAEALLELWNPHWKNYINFKKTDMDKEEYIGDFDLYLFQDSIEHALKPTIYLQKYVKQSPNHSLFLLSLPIGSSFPRHNIAWEDNHQAIAWLQNCGLEIINPSETVYVNPEVDLFAEPLGNSFHDLIVLCKKKELVRVKN